MCQSSSEMASSGISGVSKVGPSPSGPKAGSLSTSVCKFSISPVKQNVMNLLAKLDKYTYHRLISEEAQHKLHIWSKEQTKEIAAISPINSILRGYFMGMSRG